ncbi:MAG: hypothetical protein ABIJ49_11685, partial [Pseudomonadota bacterium]
SLLFLAGIFEFGEGLLHARNKAHGGGWLRGLSVPRVGAAGYLCSVSLRTGALPIGVMGLAFPLGGIYGLVHKSKQLTQQILDEKLKRLYEKHMPTVNSIDAILVHLYRLSNHSYVLNGWIVGRKRGNDQIAQKLQIIIKDWSSLYSEERFLPAMARITNLSEELDAVMCGYERGLTDHVIPGNLEFTYIMRDEHLAKFKELEQKVLEYRQAMIADTMKRQMGWSGLSV